MKNLMTTLPKLASLLFVASTFFLIGAVIAIDPTRPPTFTTVTTDPSASAGNLNLTAIFVYPTYKMAIINNRSLLVGDRLGEYTVTNIEQNTVELADPQNNKMTLTLVNQVKQIRTN